MNGFIKISFDSVNLEMRLHIDGVDVNARLCINYGKRLKLLKLIFLTQMMYYNYTYNNIDKIKSIEERRILSQLGL